MNGFAKGETGGWPEACCPPCAARVLAVASASAKLAGGAVAELLAAAAG